MRNKIGEAFFAVGTILVLAALAIYVWNTHEATKAEKSALFVLDQMTQMIDEAENDNDDSWNIEELLNPKMTVKDIDGYGYIGYLTVSKFGLQLPVMSEWDYDRLKIAPCRYKGSTKTDDLIVAAHNYTRHFGKFSHLEAGDEIKFTDMDGVETNYKVVLLDMLTPSDVEKMSAGDYDLTLFTCTYGGASRITVRCEIIQDKNSGA